MKRILCAILSIIMVLSLFPSVFAEDSELTEVVKTVKSRAEIPTEFTEFISESYTGANESVYELTWRNTEENASEIRITALSSGEIISYRYRDGNRDYDKTGIAAYKKEEYKQRALDWISKINPSYAGELDTDAVVSIGSVHSYNVSVNFRRVKDGIPVTGDSVYISLDKYTGEVISMSSDWVQAKKVADKENVISAEQAGSILSEMAGISLQYKKLRNEAHAVLMYVPRRSGMMIDAVTGEEFTVEYRDSEAEAGDGGAASGATNDSVTMDKAESSLTEEEIANIEEVESLLSKSELAGIIKKMSGTAISSFNVKTVNYRRTASFQDKNEYQAQVYLTNADGESASATFDAKTGELKSFYTYLKYNPNKKQIKSRKEMQATAERFVRNWAKDVAEKAKVFDEEEVSGYVVFTQNENGIEYAENNIRIRVDESTGKLLSFSRNWDKEITFDSPEGIISLEQATEKYISYGDVMLSYIGNGREMYADRNAEELALIYRFSDAAPVYIDAKTGEGYDWSMGQDTENTAEYKLQPDIKGHFAETAIKVLSENGIVLSYEETFRPDEKITQKEIVLLAERFNGGYGYNLTDEDYKYLVDSFISREIIKKSEKKPDSLVSREEAVSYLVRMLGFGKAAEIRGIYKTGFADEAEISAERIGYVAIAKGIGMVSGNGNACFAPKRHVTRGELAVMLYNSLNK